MNRKLQTVLFYAVVIFVALVLFWAIVYRIKTDAERVPTQAEIDAAATTARLREEKQAAKEDMTVPTVATEIEEEETDDHSADTWAAPDGDVQDDGHDQEENTEEPEVIYRNTSNSETVEHVQIGERDVLLSEDEMWELVRIIYMENGRVYPECTYQTVKLTADVLLNRLEQWGYADAYEVIWAPGQYSTANDYHDLGEANPEGWEISWTALYDALNNPDYTPVFQSMSPQGVMYYEDPYTGECFGY
jgi:hypothetical protein